MDWMPMKVVWHADHLLERDWLRDLFGDLIEEEVTDLELTCFDDRTVHVVSGNCAPLPEYNHYFQECRARSKCIALIHTSDEWFSGGYSLYKYFDLVFRNYRTYLANDIGIVTVPLGYPNGTVTSRSIRAADKRGLAWSFNGEIKASRVAMALAFKGVESEGMTRSASARSPDGTRLSKVEFDDVLDDTVFSLCPMGNANIETWRLYESLECGCIPLVEKRCSLDYYENLFGPNPIPVFSNWIEARRFAEMALTDKQGLLHMQKEVRDWWTAHKIRLRSQVRAAIGGPSRSAELRRYGDKVRNRFSVIHEALRLVEILRHQSVESLQRRIANPRPGMVVSSIAHSSIYRQSAWGGRPMRSY